MRFTSLADWVYVDDELKTIFSHAGVSEVWMKEILKESDVHNINDYGLREEFGFTPDRPGDYSGDSFTQPPTWIRPSSLVYCYVPGWNQVIGHTPVTKNIVDLGKILNLPVHIWTCDALGINQYLTIDNGIFQPKTFKYDSTNF